MTVTMRALHGILAPPPMSKTNFATLNALRALFGVRAASRLFKRSRGRASRILEAAELIQ